MEIKINLTNNYRKLHGMPMKRRKHLFRAIAEEIDRMFDSLGPEWTSDFLEWMEEHCVKPYVGIDLAQGRDFSTCVEKEIMSRQMYGQPVINQNAVVKIVTSGEENYGDEY